ncbi:MAG: hypothetical protein HC897_04060 [Thermoanaerobaculia bacterium]|nr:hypothetical protein [Thermoanaerobaculia bacterium]
MRGKVVICPSSPRGLLAGDGQYYPLYPEIATEISDLFQQISPRGTVVEHGYDHARRLISIERKPDASPTSHGERIVYSIDKYGNPTREELQRWSGGWVTESATEYVRSTRCHLDKVIYGAGSPNESIVEQAYDCDRPAHPRLGRQPPFERPDPAGQARSSAMTRSTARRRSPNPGAAAAVAPRWCNSTMTCKTTSAR